MSSNYSRQGLALGVSAALAMSLLGGVPASANTFQKLNLSLAEEHTNDVLATVAGSAFYMDLDYSGLPAYALADLMYEIDVLEVNGAGEDFIEVKAMANYIYWDEQEDDIYQEDTFNFWDSEDAEDRFTLSAPAAINVDDDVVRYSRTVTAAGGAICNAGSDNELYGQLPENYSFSTDGSGNGSQFGCGGNSATYNVTYTYVSGLSGVIQREAPATFQPRLALGVSELDYDLGIKYVDVRVRPWVDVNGNDVRDNNEFFGAAVTVRFWNPVHLTPVLTVNPTWVYEEDIEEDGGFYQSVSLKFTQELNGVGDGEDVIDILNGADFWAFSDVDFDNVRNNIVRDYDYYTSFDSFEFDGKHLTSTESGMGGLFVELPGVNRIGVANDNRYHYVSEDLDEGYHLLTPLQAPNFKYITAEDASVAVVEQDLVWSEDGRSRGSEDAEDAFAHVSVKTVQYTVTVDGGMAGDDVEVTGYVEANGAFTVNGEAFEDEDYVVEGKLNAAGQFVVTFTLAAPVAGDYAYIDTVTTQSVTFEVDGDLNWEEDQWSIKDALNFPSDRVVQVGQTTTVDYTVRNQWKKAPANGNAKVELYFEDYSGGVEVRDYDGFFGPYPVVNGAVAVTLPDTNPAAGEGRVDVEVALYHKSSVGAWTGRDGSGFRIYYWNDAAVDTITLTASTPAAAVAYINFRNFDFEIERFNRLYVEDLSEFAHATVTGRITNTEGGRLSGQPVTVSGSGLYFVHDEGEDLDEDDLFRASSLTVFSEEDGSYTFRVFGQKTGSHTVTITSGGKSTTATITIASSTVRSENISLAAFAGKAGTAEAIVATVTDRYGNLVNAGSAVSFSRVSGSGHFNGATNGIATVNTNADGVAQADLVIMSGEIGFNSTVMATVCLESAPTVCDGDKTVSAQRSAGDTELMVTRAWTKRISPTQVKIYAKNIVGAGKVQFFHNGKEIAWVRAIDATNPKLFEGNGSFYLVRTATLVAGKNRFEVRIDGERVRFNTYTR